MTNLILIDSRIPGIDDIISSLTPNTESVVFDYLVDTLEDIQLRIQKPYESIAIVQHNYGSPFFNMLKSMDNAVITDVMNVDIELESWKGFIDFIQWLKQNGANYVDLLACNLWSNPDWVYVIEQLRSRLKLTIRASIDITGVDGNFILESDNFNMIGYYFTENILNYKYNFYASSTPDINGLSYTPIIFTASNPGYIPATAYNSILGTTASIPLTTDISNVAMVSMTKGAVAVLQTNGNVVTYGDSNYGANSSTVSSQLYNITKIVSTYSWFTALRSDGKVFSWGGQNYKGTGANNEINSWTNTGNGDILLFDISSTLVNIVDIFSNYAGSFALTSSGKLIGWGGSSYANTNFSQLSSGIVSVIPDGYQSTVVIKSTGVAYLFKGTTITDSSVVSGTNTNTIINAYLYNSYAILSRSASSNTTQLTSFNGTYALYYTIPAGVFIIRTEGYSTYILVLLSNNVLLIINCAVGGTCTEITNVTDIVTNRNAYAYLQNNVVVIVGNSMDVTSENRGVPSGATLTNVRKLVSSYDSFGVLKYDNTFVWWGSITHSTTTNYSVEFQTNNSALYAATSSNIVSIYSCSQGFVFTKIDGSIVVFGTLGWANTMPITNYGTKRTNKNVLFVPNQLGFIAVETTPTVSCSLSQFIQSVSTTFTYYNNNPDIMAIKGRKYSLMLGTTVLGTWNCTADSFTYTFTGIIFSQSGNNTISIYDTTNGTTPYTVIGTVTLYIFANQTVSAPTINSVTGGNNSITVLFTSGDSASVYLYEYAFVTNSVVGTFNITSSIASPIIILGLTNGVSYQVVLRAVSSLGRYSSVSNTSNAVIPATVSSSGTPTIPTAPIITSFQPGNGLITVNWITPNINGAAITNVLYNLSGGTYVSSTYVSAGTANSSFNITGLTNGTTYSVTIIVVNSYGQSLPSSSSSVVPITVPNPPTVTSVVPGDSKVQISLTPGSLNGSTFIGYKYSLDSTSYQWVKDNTSPITINGLTNGTSYTIYLKSVGQTVGDSSAVALSSPVIPYKPPDAPVIQSISVGNGSAVITFLDGSTNGITLTGYKYSLDAVNYLDISAVNHTISLSGLTNGTTYNVTLKSISSVATSAASVSVSLIPYTNPSAPTVTSVVPGNQSASVYITNGSANGSGSTLAYKYTIDNTNFYWASSATSPIVISSGLVGNQSYNVKIATQTTLGMSAYSSQSSTFIPYTLPSAPTITSVVAGNGSASLYFTDGSSNGSSITSYQYTINDITYSAVTGTSPLPLTGLTNGTSYIVTLKNANSAGYSSVSLESSAFIPFTVPTSALIANIIPGNGQLTVIMDGWNSYLNITGYKYSLDDGPLVLVSSSSDSFVIDGLVNGQDYVVKAKACTTVGESPISSAYSPIHPNVPPNPPMNVVVTPLNESAIITFTDGSANGEPIQYYIYSLSGEIDTPIDKREDGTIKIFGISNKINYTIRLRAVNNAGVSNYSDESNIFMPFGIPIVSPVITSIIPGNACVYVNFSEADTNGASLTKFKWTDGVKTYDVSGTISPLIITNTISNKKAVSVSIASCNLVGDSPFTIARSIIPGVPLAPVITQVVPGPKKLLVYFDVPLDNDFAITSYSYGFLTNTGLTPLVKGSSASISSASPLQITNLINGTSYNIKIVASNPNGNSSTSNSLGNQIPCEPPLKVVISNVTPLIDGAIVAFTTPSNNGSVLLKYKYALVNSTSDGTTYTDISGLNLPVRIYDIPPNTNNTIKIIATNATGDSIESAQSKPFKFVYLPPFQIKVTALTIAMNLLTISFVAPLTNGASITGYKYALDASGETPGSYIDASGTTASIVVSGVTKSIVVTEGVLSNVIYNVRVVSLSDAGQSVASAPFAKPVRFVYLPTVQIKVATLTIAMNQLTISFPAPVKNGALITGYKYALDASGATPGSFIDASGATASIVVAGITTSIIVTEGVLPNVTYNVRVVSLSDAGQSVASAPFAKPVRFVYLPPSQIIGVTLAIALNQLTMTFAIPLTNGAPITGYKYALDASGATPGSFINASRTNAAIVVTEEVLPNVTYNVRVVSLSDAGQSVASAPAVKPVRFVYLPPSQITGVTLVIALNQLTITFATPVKNGALITGYKYALDASGSAQGSFIDASGETASIVVSGTTTSIIVTEGVLPNVTYNVRVVSLSDAGQSVASVLAVKPVLFIYLPPLAPTITSIVSGNMSATVIFTGQLERGAPVTGYSYTLDASATTIYDLSGVSPLTVPELINDVSYNVRIAAITPAGRSAWSLARPVTPVYRIPDKPIITTVTAGNEKLTVVFTPPAANGSPITGYKYTTDDINIFEIATIVGGKSFVITGLTNGTLYIVKMYATNSLGDSLISLALSGTPKV